MKKRGWFWAGLVLTFVVGLFGGAYLVLRSPASQGELINSTSLAEGKSSDELLEELLKINQDEEAAKNTAVPPEEKNLTEDFFQKIISETGLTQKTATEISSNDFLVSTVLPYLKSNQLTLFPLIPDSVLNIVPDSKATNQRYYKTTNQDVVTFYNAMRETVKLNPDKINDANTLSEIESNANKLSSAFESLSATKVPLKLTTVHKNVLISVFSLQKYLEALVNSETDPLKSLLVINDAETLGDFWKQTLYDYTQVPESKRK